MRSNRQGMGRRGQVKQPFRLLRTQTIASTLSEMGNDQSLGEKSDISHVVQARGDFAL